MLHVLESTLPVRPHHQSHHQSLVVYLSVCLSCLAVCLSLLCTALLTESADPFTSRSATLFIGRLPESPPRIFNSHASLMPLCNLLVDRWRRDESGVYNHLRGVRWRLRLCVGFGPEQAFGCEAVLTCADGVRLLNLKLQNNKQERGGGAREREQ